VSMTDDDEAENRRKFAARLVTEHRRRINAQARKFRLDPQDWDDLAQTVYVRLTGVDPSTIRNPEAYLFVTTRNVLIEWAAQGTREGARIDIGDPFAAVEFRELSDTPDFGRMIDMEQLTCILHSVLGELRPKCRAVVALHFFHGMKCEEVAERLGFSIDSVKRYVKQALRHCRRRISRLHWTDADE